MWSLWNAFSQAHFVFCSCRPHKLPFAVALLDSETLGADVKYLIESIADMVTFVNQTRKFGFEGASTATHSRPAPVALRQKTQTDRQARWTVGRCLRTSHIWIQLKTGKPFGYAPLFLVFGFCEPSFEPSESRKFIWIWIKLCECVCGGRSKVPRSVTKTLNYKTNLSENLCLSAKL